jgi:hypothetical protein
MKLMDDVGRHEVTRPESDVSGDDFHVMGLRVLARMIAKALSSNTQCCRSNMEHEKPDRQAEEMDFQDIGGKE